MNSTREAVAAAFTLMADSLEQGYTTKRFSVGLTVSGSEHGEDEVLRAAQLAIQLNPQLDIVLIGGHQAAGFRWYAAGTLEEAHKKMEELLQTGVIEAAVTMHYTFPLGVATVGKVVTPARGKEMYIATTTGASDTDRCKSMVLNMLAGIAVAKANGISSPTVGILNIEGAAIVEKAVRTLNDSGYECQFVESVRADGGLRMRGNDLLQGTADVLICDSLTGNVLMKMFSSFLTGGSYEAVGAGYGPCVGSAASEVIAIVSRASGAPVIAAALNFAARSAQGCLPALYKKERAAAEKAGLAAILSEISSIKGQPSCDCTVPPRKVVTQEIHGIDVIDIEHACKVLWQAEVYAETGMGCTGPVILLAGEDEKTAREILGKNGFL